MTPQTRGYRKFSTLPYSCRGAVPGRQLLRSVVKRVLFGTTIAEEYICIGREDLERRSRVVLGGRDAEHPAHLDDHLDDHLIFLGYKPLVMAIHFPADAPEARWLADQPSICLSYAPDPGPFDAVWKGHRTFRDAIARLILTRVSRRRLGAHDLSIWRGVEGAHRFLSPFHQATNRWRDRLASDQPGNVRLPGNLYDQARIAYSVPIGISIVTLKDGPLMNMFPTDLHGPVGEDHYVGSLRCGSRATEQVERLGVAAISEVEAGWHKQAYALGKNHMRDPRSPADFSRSDRVSEEREIPLPAGTVATREVERLDAIDVGIHRIHFYRSGPRVELSQAITLAHLHRFYLQWRNNHRLPTTIFPR